MHPYGMKKHWIFSVYKNAQKEVLKQVVSLFSKNNCKNDSILMWKKLQKKIIYFFIV